MTAPNPLTTIDHDIEGYDGFLLNVQKLMSSELWALATGDEFKAAVGLWCRAWTQVPHGSLPDDDRVLAGFSGAGAKWKKVKAMAIRGFIKCSDGRLYHETLCDDVIRASESKRKRKDRTKNATEARQNQRDAERNDERDVEQETTVTTSNLKVKGIEGSSDGLSAGDLEAKLRAAAGWEQQPAPNLYVTGEIEALLAAGCDLERDVLPIVKALAPNVRSPTSWKYFLKAIAQARDDRLAAGNLKFEGKPHAANTRQPNTVKAGFAIIDAELDALERKLTAEETGSASGGQGELIQTTGSLSRLRENAA